jgi:hypothetical protein
MATTDTAVQSKARTIAIDRLHVPNNVRALDQAHVDALAGSIALQGQIVPVIVRSDGENYVLGPGEPEPADGRAGGRVRRGRSDRSGPGRDRLRRHQLLCGRGAAHGRRPAGLRRHHEHVRTHRRAPATSAERGSTSAWAVRLGSISRRARRPRPCRAPRRAGARDGRCRRGWRGPHRSACPWDRAAPNRCNACRG